MRTGLAALVGLPLVLAPMATVFLPPWFERQPVPWWLAAQILVAATLPLLLRRAHDPGAAGGALAAVVACGYVATLVAGLLAAAHDGPPTGPDWAITAIMGALVIGTPMLAGIVARRMGPPRRRVAQARGVQKA